MKLWETSSNYPLPFYMRGAIDEVYNARERTAGVGAKACLRVLLHRGNLFLRLQPCLLLAHPWTF